jgi:hypothetical protein
MSTWAKIYREGLVAACAVASPREGPLTEIVWAENPNWFLPGTTVLPVLQ